MIYFRNKEYSKAAGRFERAVSLWREQGGNPEWEEAMLVNLGHARRKLGQYTAAVLCFEQALALNDCAETHAALAFTCHLGGDHDKAIQHYHDALSLAPHHAFAIHMLSAALSALPLPSFP